MREIFYDSGTVSVWSQPSRAPRECPHAYLLSGIPVYPTKPKTPWN